MLRSFVWQGTVDAHTNFLFKHKQTGGMGFPDMKDNYYSVRLNCKHWWFIEQNKIPKGRCSLTSLFLYK